MNFRAIAFALILAAAAFTQTGSTNSAPRPNGWLVRPLGRTTQIGGFPIASALTSDGQFLLVLNSGTAPTLRVFATKNERQISSLTLTDAWLGLTLSPNGRLVYVSSGPGAGIQELQLSPEGELRMARTMSTASRDHAANDNTDQLIGDVVVSPDGRMLYAADVLHDQVLVINLSSGRVIERHPAGRRPYRIAFHPNGKSYFVTGWADGSLTQYEALTGRRINGVGVGAHATDIAWRDKKTQLEEGEEAAWAARLFIPAANTNNVYAAAITEAGDLRIVERIALGLFVDSPVGMTPSAVALSPDQSRLYVACSDANALAVVDVSGVKGRLLGFIPTGEYPTGVRTLNDGRIVVLNGEGSVLFINPPADEALAVPTGIVLANSPLKDLDPRQRPIAMNPIPFTPGEPTPLEHIVYILRDGAPHTTAGEQAAPNQFKLAREFTSLSNFTATGATPLEGFYWSTAAIVPDFIRKLQPAIHDSLPKIDELDIAAQPPAGYLWNALPARLFGIVPTARASRGVVVAAPLTNADFKAPDRTISDMSRAQVFLKELTQFEQQQTLPKLMMLRLAGDRPVETAKGQRTVQAAIADTDYALGLILERLSHSKFWPKMAVFLVGTHAADHKASAIIASPYATRGKVTNGAFNTLSVVRTIEHILGLSPLTQFDAGAAPLDDAFQMTPDLRPFDAERPRVSTDALVQ